jgi:rSAM/selenodomain-associated transferase 1
MNEAASASLALLVFARAPEPGRAKTRLIPALGAAGAARLQARMTQQVLASAGEAGVGDVELWCTPSADHPFFQHCAQRWPLRLRTQTGADLGARLRAAHDRTFAHAGRIIIVGTDCPTLSAPLLQAVSDEMTHHDAVIVPAEDGGYVLLALSRPCPEAFVNIEWGSATVFAQTLRRLRQRARSVFVHAPLWDVDRPEDLPRLQSVLPHLLSE